MEWMMKWINALCNHGDRVNGKLLHCTPGLSLDHIAPNINRMIMISTNGSNRRHSYWHLWILRYDVIYLTQLLVLVQNIILWIFNIFPSLCLAVADPLFGFFTTTAKKQKWEVSNVINKYGRQKKSCYIWLHSNYCPH